jgi:23S rRNA (guanosine2251-2'-O)-methyltransferase
MSEILSGRNPILEAIKSGRSINKILIEKTTRHGVIAEIINLAKQNKIPLEFVDRQAIARILPAASNQGIAAFVAAKDYASLEDLFAITESKQEPALYLILDGLEDPQNFGAILRTADAAGVHGVIIRERREVGLTEAVSRASAGAVEYVPVARVANITNTIEDLKKKGLWITGIDMTGTVSYTNVDYKGPVALVVGGEGQGLSPLVRQHCDNVVRIPMKGKISSLNASVAAAVIIYEVLRQRG